MAIIRGRNEILVVRNPQVHTKTHKHIYGESFLRLLQRCVSNRNITKLVNVIEKENQTIINKTTTIINDLLPGIIISGAPMILAVGQNDTKSFKGLYSITQLDINRGSISNQATVTGISPAGIVVKDLSDDFFCTCQTYMIL